MGAARARSGPAGPNELRAKSQCCCSSQKATELDTTVGLVARPHSLVPDYHPARKEYPCFVHVQAYLP